MKKNVLSTDHISLDETVWSWLLPLWISCFILRFLSDVSGCITTVNVTVDENENPVSTPDLNFREVFDTALEQTPCITLAIFFFLNQLIA